MVRVVVPEAKAIRIQPVVWTARMSESSGSKGPITEVSKVAEAPAPEAVM